MLDLELGEPSEGTSTRCAVRVGYNEAGQAAGLPTVLFTKSTPHFRSRLLGVAAGEGAFFSMIRPGLSMETPHCHLAAYDAASGRSMFLLEDLTSTRSASFCDPRETKIDRSLAEDAIRQLATLHGTFWDSASASRPTFVGCGPPPGPQTSARRSSCDAAVRCGLR